MKTHSYVYMCAIGFFCLDPVELTFTNNDGYHGVPLTDRATP